VEATELGHTIPLFRAAPAEVLAEREAMWTADLTPNMAVLGDPLPGAGKFRGTISGNFLTP
jgi:hypothetical protein